MNDLYTDGSFSPSYDPDQFPDLINVLMPSQMRQVLGAVWAESQGYTGEGVRVFMVDSGVSLDTPFYASRGVKPPMPVTFMPTVLPSGEPGEDTYPESYGDLDSLGIDYVGHGTMCSSGVHILAPYAEVVMFTVPFDYYSVESETAMFGEPDLVQLLNALCTMADVIQADKASGRRERHVLALTTTFSKAQFKPPFTEENEFDEAGFVDAVLATRQALRDLWNVGCVVLSPAGNHAIDYQQSTCPSLVPEVISVGGAYPTSLDFNPKNEEPWVLSDLSVSGFPGSGQDGVHPCLIQDVGNLTLKDHTVPWVCSIEGSYEKDFKANSLGEVSLILPVSPGLTAEALKEMLQEEFGGAWWLILTLLLAAGALPMDNEEAYTSVSDGWVVTKGGTSYATAVLAGCLALLLQEHALLPVPNGTGIDWLSRIGSVKQYLGICTVDVHPGISATGDWASVGPEVASGQGVVLPWKLLVNAGQIGDGGEGE